MTPKQLLICAMLAGLPLVGAAQQARSTTWVSLRAGPASDYPLVGRLAPGTPLSVQGCTAGFGWCDVVAPGAARGWVYGGNIAYLYQSAEVPIIGYGAVIGIPIVVFVIGSYWGQYYRDRPWYGHAAHLGSSATAAVGLATALCPSATSDRSATAAAAARTGLAPAAEAASAATPAASAAAVTMHQHRKLARDVDACGLLPRGAAAAFDRSRRNSEGAATRAPALHGSARRRPTHIRRRITLA